MTSSLSVLLDAYHELKSDYQGLALATVVSTWGSTFIKPGARMLITPDGKAHGTPATESLQHVIISLSRGVFESGQPFLAEIGPGTVDGTGQALELDPDVRIGVYIEYLDSNTENTLELVSQALDSGRDTVLICICDSGVEDCPPGTSLLLVDRTVIPHGLLPGYTDALIEIAASVRELGQPTLESCMLEAGTLTVFVDLVRQPVRLLVIGPQPVSMSLQRLAGSLGWETSWLGYDAAAEAGEDDFSACNAAVLMNFRFEHDLALLSRQTGSGTLRYIGVAGTADYGQRLLDALPAAREYSMDRLYMPAGSDAGTMSEEALALAIISEIQAVTNGNPARVTQGRAVISANSQPVARIEDVYAVVLAAGGSRRFGGIKQLLEYKGKSLLKRVIELSTETLQRRVKLVLGIKPNKLQREADGYDLEVVVNRDWENGIASSIRAGIKSLPDSCEGVLLILCDQPLVEREHLDTLLQEWLIHPASIIASEYGDTVGVPALFPRRYFNQMLELKGDRGAKSIIEGNIDNVCRVRIEEAGTDIDTQEDVIKLLRM